MTTSRSHGATDAQADDNIGVQWWNSLDEIARRSLDSASGYDVDHPAVSPHN
jgi:hypothetical protein